MEEEEKGKAEEKETRERGRGEDRVIVISALFGFLAWVFYTEIAYCCVGVEEGLSA